MPGKCRQHHHRKLAIIFFAVAPMVGCNPRQPSSETPKPVPARATSSSHQSALSPLETIRALHEFRNSGRYAEMQDLIVPDYRTEILELILSVDELVAAELKFQNSVREVVGEGTATYFAHRMQVANIVGPFSRDVEAVSETITGNTARVAIQVAGRVPLEEVALTNLEGKWLVQSDKPIPKLADELRNLARTTRSVADDVVRRHLTAKQAQHELDLRQEPVLKRINDLIDDSE